MLMLSGLGAKSPRLSPSRTGRAPPKPPQPHYTYAGTWVGIKETKKATSRAYVHDDAPKGQPLIKTT